MNNLKIGDWVRVVDSNVGMTVAALPQGCRVLCQWREDGYLREAYFDARYLRDAYCTAT